MLRKIAVLIAFVIVAIIGHNLGATTADAAKPPDNIAGLGTSATANARAIVKAGRAHGVDNAGIAVALATASQESNFQVLTNSSVPESLNYPNDGSGQDNDSIGQFQQRSDGTWGTVAELMSPEQSAVRFFFGGPDAPGLSSVDYHNMSTTEAAQTVQVSAFPDAYADDADLAWKILKVAG